VLVCAGNILDPTALWIGTGQALVMVQAPCRDTQSRYLGLVCFYYVHVDWLLIFGTMDSFETFVLYLAVVGYLGLFDNAKPFHSHIENCLIIV
jgi:hypothetical protein